MSKTCLDCGKEIGPNADRCRSCAATFRNLNGGGNFKDGHTLVQKTCVCGNLMNWDSEHCRECNNKISANRLSLLEHPKLALLQTHKVCRTCKQELPVSQFRIHKRGYYQSDCKICQTIVHREYIKNNRSRINEYNLEFNHRTGKSKFWGQGKRPKLNRPIRLNEKIYCPTWNEIKKEIYKRDNWTCQECGVHCSNKGQIQCHHIDENTANNLSINLITLCNSCHAIVHWNEQNLEEYFIEKIILAQER